MPDQTYSGTLADEGGALQLVDSVTAGATTNVTVHNQLAWSNDKTLPADTRLFAAPGAGASLQRLPNSDTEYLNDDGTLTVFTADTRLSPESAWAAPVPVDPSAADEGDGSGVTDGTDEPVTLPPTDNTGLLPPVITELLPNPAAPQTDETNEYIELFNPNDTAFNLNGYTLQTGETTLHNFTFTADLLLDPHSFRSFYSAETGLSLSNSGGQARLLDKSGTVLGESAMYGAAVDGQVWALADDGTWQWSIQPTPGAENLIQAPAVAVKKGSVKVAARTTKKTSGKVKGVSTTKKKAAAKKAKTKKLVAATSAASGTSSPAPAPIHTSVLVAVAVLTVGYMVYEYRTDVANYFHKLRTDRAARRSARR